MGATAGRVDALSNGAVLATSNSFGTSALAYSFARIGTPTAERVYVTASRNANTTQQYFNGSTWTNSAAPTCSFLGVTPADNRLVAACDTTNRSRVKFSDAGDPETFGANNYVDLDPGDGEQIMAICNWREQLFVFKQTKFFRFYGTSTDEGGNLYLTTWL